MKRITFLTGAGGLLAALLATPLAAQHTTHVGILGGVDFATFAGSDASGGSFFDPGSGLTMSATKGSSTNFLGGIFVQIPAGKSLWFEPQLLYEGKGANYAATISDGSTTVSGDMTFNVDYLTIPVLLRYDFEEGGGPYGLVGPEVSFNLGCSVDFSGGLSAAGSLDCSSDVGVETTTTFGAVVGLGYQRKAVGLEARYDFDFGSAFKDSDIKNTAWEILLRYRFR